MASKKIKYVGIIGGLLAAGGIYLLSRKIQQSRMNAGLLNDDSAAGSTAAQPIKAASNDFPLKNGSNNALVKQLQTYLAVDADGKFGPKTAAALLALTGKYQIKDQAEFDQVIKSLQAKKAVSASSVRANDLISKYKGSGSAQLATIAKTTLYQVVQDAYGALQPTGKTLSQPAGLKLARTDYVPIAATTNGFLTITITKGALAGLYKVDPNKYTIV